MKNQNETNETNAYRSERKERLAKSAKKKNKKRIDSYILAKVILSVVCAVLVVAAACGILYAYGVPQRLLPAVTIKGEKHSVAEYEYFYSTVYSSQASQASSIAEQYGSSLLSALGYFDYTVHPEKQSTTDDDGNKITWAAYFDENVIETMQTFDYYLEQCEELGIELTDEDIAEIDSDIETVQGYADNYSVSLTRYLSSYYGKGMTAKLYRKLVENQKLAEKYNDFIEEQNEAAITDEAIQQEYEANPSDYQVVDLRVFGFSTDGSSVTATEDETDTAVEEQANNVDAPEVAFLNAEVEAEDEIVIEGDEVVAAADEAIEDEAIAEEAEPELVIAPAPETDDAEETEEDAVIAEADTETDTETETEATEEEAEEELSEEVKALLAKAEEYCSRITDEASFVDLAVEYADPADAETFANDSATQANQISKSVVTSNISADLAEWLFDGTRVVGDKTSILSDDGDYVYVIYIVKAPYLEEDAKVTARHILVSYETGVNAMNAATTETEADTTAETEDETAVETEEAESTEETETAESEVVNAADAATYAATAANSEETFGLTIDYALAAEQSDTYTEDVVNATYAAAYDIYQAYLEDATEDNFASLANSYSADTSSTTAAEDLEDGEEGNGGLYEDIAKGSMVANFDSWVYDADRNAGDVSIIQTEYGFHIMYFVSRNERPDWEEEIVTKLTEAATTEFNTKLEEIVADKSEVVISSFKNYAYKESIKLIEKTYGGTYFEVED